MKWLIELIKSLFSKKKIEEPVIEKDDDIDTTENLDNDDENVDEIIAIIEEETKKEKEKDSSVIASCPEYKQYPNLVVCLDNGHGANTPGKCSPWVASKVKPELYFREYKFAREIVSLVKEGLEKYGVEVYIVCPEENEISLTKRYTRANTKKINDRNPDKNYLFISVHSNAIGNGTKWMNASGWSAWTTKGQNNSDKLANCLYEIADEVLPKLGQSVRKDASDKDPDYESNFTVIYGANMPAVLTENMFQDNIEDVKFMLSDEGKAAIADIHIRGIIKYAEKYLK